MNPVGVAVRMQAARTLDAVLRGRSLKAELAVQLPQLADPRDRALVEAICFTALRERRRYEYALAQWMSHPLPASESLLHALLLVGFAQLVGLDLPAYAAISATAEAARMFDRPRHVGLINKMLRRAQREALPVTDDPAIALGHPDWLLALLRTDWPEDWRAIAEANLRAAPLWLRVNTTKIARAHYAQRLRENNIAVRGPDRLEAAFMLDRRVSTSRLPGWEEGWVSVQDGAAQLAVAALHVRPGERVLDACAAPGGKTAQLLECARALDLVAVDIDAARLDRVRATLTRLGLADQRIALHAADAGEPATWWDGTPFDAIVLDAPCSATGIIRRQPDILWHRRPSDITALTATQTRLLTGLWPTLKPGGRLLYATCSVLRAENEQRIVKFLANATDARVVPLDARFGRAICVQGRVVGHQRLPGEDGMDGFFYALLKKVRRER